MNLFSLDGKIALVTGAGGRGIGRGISEGLCACGATVVAAARTRSELDDFVEKAKESGSDALAVEMDISDLDSVRGVVRTSLDRFGKIDILVNNAGMNRKYAFVDVEEETYDRTM